MRKWKAWALALLIGSSTCLASDLTAAESRWLKGAWPVLTYALDAGLPLDIIVQPQPMPDAPPLALAFVDGRCKLVLSMRGNEQVPSTLERIAPELLDATLELMAAHELGHCRRYLDGVWHGLPVGFLAHVPQALAPELRDAYLDMRAVRREEGYADLVGLAWTRQRHPDLYARLHAWLVSERELGLVPGSHHDTLAWARLAADPAALNGRSIFSGAGALWLQGLAEDD